MYSFSAYSCARRLMLPGVGCSEAGRTARHSLREPSAKGRKTLLNLRSPSAHDTSRALPSPPDGSSMLEVDLNTQASKPSSHDLLNRQVLRTIYRIHAGDRVSIEHVVQIHVCLDTPLRSELEDFGHPQVELCQSVFEHCVRRHDGDHH